MNTRPTQTRSTAACEALRRNRWDPVWLVSVLMMLVGSWVGTVQAQTIKAGIFSATLGTTAGVTYTDNVNLSQANRQSDLQYNFGPTLNGGFHFGPRLPGGEEVNLSISAGYSTSYSSRQGKWTESFGNPAASTVMLPLYMTLGEWRFALLEQFAYTRSVLSSTYAFNSAQTSQINNTLILSAVRRFGKVSLTLAAERLDQEVPELTSLGRTEYIYSATPSYAMNQFVSVFWQNSYSVNHYNTPSAGQSDSWAVNSSVGINGQITANISGSISIGWQHVEIQPVGTALGPGGIFGGIFGPQTNDTQTINGLTSSVSLSYVHPLRPNITHAVSVVHSPGVTGALQNSSVTDVSTVSYSISYQVNSKLTLAPVVSWSHLNTTSGQQQVVDLVTAGFGMSRGFSKHANGSITYLFQDRSSNLKGQSYDVNTITAALNYTF